MKFTGGNNFFLTYINNPFKITYYGIWKSEFLFSSPHQIISTSTNGLVFYGCQGDLSNIYSAGHRSVSPYSSFTRDGVSGLPTVEHQRVVLGLNDKLYSVYVDNEVDPDFDECLILRREGDHAWTSVLNIKTVLGYIPLQATAMFGGDMTYVPPVTPTIPPHELNTAELRDMSGNRPPTFNRCVLYQQFSGNIVAIDNASKLRVAGDATELLSVGDNILLPLKQFDSEYTITICVYDSIADQTQITVDSGDFRSEEHTSELQSH